MPLPAQIFDLDRLDKDGSKTADRAELLAALEGSEAARQAKLAEWGGEASTKDKLLKDIEELHEVTEEPETVYTGYEFGKRHGSKDTPDKQKWIRREIMPVSPRTRRPPAPPAPTRTHTRPPEDQVLGPGPGPGPGLGQGPGSGPGPGPDPGYFCLMKIMELDLKWVHMARYGLILRQDEAIRLRVISKPLLTTKRAM